MDWTSFTINLVSIVLAFAAFWLSWKEVHRCNNVVIRLEDVSHSYVDRIGENDEKPFHQLSFRIRNKGLSLHETSASLSFIVPGGGQFNFPLVLETGHARQTGEFSRGMIAAYILKSHRLDEHARPRRFPGAFRNRHRSLWRQDFLPERHEREVGGHQLGQRRRLPCDPGVVLMDHLEGGGIEGDEGARRACRGRRRHGCCGGERKLAG